jgi:methionyl-tRNA formyltransferase
MKMDEGLDTGPILTQQSTPIRAADNAQSLHDRLAELGAQLLCQTIPSYLAGQIVPRPQPSEGITYARKITREDGRLDWRLPARQLNNQIRAFTPWPGSFTLLPGSPKPVLLKIWAAEVAAGIQAAPGEIVSLRSDGIVVGCGEEGLRITELQREGKRRMNTREFLAGFDVRPGTRFEDAQKRG